LLFAEQYAQEQSCLSPEIAEYAEKKEELGNNEIVWIQEDDYIYTMVDLFFTSLDSNGMGSFINYDLVKDYNTTFYSNSINNYKLMKQMHSVFNSSKHKD
jgi:hypothetical protein